jgi:cell division septum initiation protein DivIVA
MDFKIDYLVLYACADSIFLQGLILSNALRTQKNGEDERCVIALGNLRSEIIKLRNEAMEKDKILLSLVDRVKKDEAKFNTQSEAYKAEIEDLQKKLTEANENFALAKASQEISEWSNTRLEKNVEELRESKERCFEKSLDCVRKLKTSFAKVGAYSSEENFIRGDPEGVIDWISREAFEEILSDHGDICAFTGARGIAAILENGGCDHIKAAAETEATFSTDDMRDPSTKATLVGGKFYSDV